MMSQQQEETKRIRILKVTKCFLEHGGSIKDIAAATNIPESTIQRDLHDKEIIELFGKEIYDAIQEKLKQNKVEALSKGGTNYALNNDYTKDQSGKFTGSARKNNTS